jgi:Rrf2 family protein
MPNNIKISEKTHIAVRLLSRLADEKTKKPKSLGEIAIEEGVSFYFLQKISRLLTKNKLIAATRGSQGGYKLTKPASKISLKEICEAIEGPLSLIDCANYKCCANTGCASKKLWADLNRKIEKTFGQVKLSDIL